MDDDEKVRRNLMISSFAVLLFFWLALPEGVILKRIIGNDYDNSTNPIRLWCAILVVLIYQLVRFTASLSESSSYTQMRDRFAWARHDEISNWLCGKISKNHQGKKIVGLGSVRILDVVSFEYEEVNLDWPTAKLAEISGYQSKSIWSGSAKISDKNYSGHNSQLHADFEIDKRKRLSIELRAVAVLAKTSFFPEIGVPLFCSYAALLSTAYQIGKLI